ncbi:hypothetical protein DID88_003814 [Monilinia fructigena]|uniref:TRP C-terminal domain-containing protein n=1 Tax=Monilinia fructigena TaxID=38457 RepID=A0A395ISV8_9HELO|nr:hypothetical protein DID88_003814 [Monilinia fructigena]
MLNARDIVTTVNGTTDSASDTTTATAIIEEKVAGIKAYVEELSVPEANTFMTVLLIVACVIAELSSQFSLSKSCLRPGHSSHLSLRVSPGSENIIGKLWLVFFYSSLTRSLRQQKILKERDGDVSGLYEKKDNWLKYSMFYENYKEGLLVLFVPAIIYMFAKGCVLAAGDGHGLTQTVAQLIIEAAMLGSSFGVALLRGNRQTSLICLFKLFAFSQSYVSSSLWKNSASLKPLNRHRRCFSLPFNQYSPVPLPSSLV